MEGKKDIYTPIMAIHPPPHPPNLLNIPLPSKCCKSRAIWLLFKMSQITHILFDEKNEGGKKLFSTERERGGGGPLHIKSNENIIFTALPKAKDLK